MLRAALFGNVKSADNFDSCDQCGMQADVVPHGFVQHAIHTEPDPHLVFHRLDMDIAGSPVDRLLDDLS